MTTSTMTKYERKAREQMSATSGRNATWYVTGAWVDFGVVTFMHALIVAAVFGAVSLLGYRQQGMWLYAYAGMSAYTLYNLYKTIRQVRAYRNVGAKWGRD